MIRDLFTKTKEAKIRGYKPGRFSFNVKGGRCEAWGQDQEDRDAFLPDVFVSATCARASGTTARRWRSPTAARTSATC